MYDCDAVVSALSSQFGNELAHIAVIMRVYSDRGIWCVNLGWHGSVTYMVLHGLTRLHRGDLARSVAVRTALLVALVVGRRLVRLGVALGRGTLRAVQPGRHSLLHLGATQACRDDHLTVDFSSLARLEPSTRPSAGANYTHDHPDKRAGAVRRHL